MKVKELIAKFPHYQIVEQGFPDSLPFTQLPKELQGLQGREYYKVFYELEVKGFKALKKDYVCIDITSALFGGKKKPNPKYEGTLYIYLKGDK